MSKRRPQLLDRLDRVRIVSWEWNELAAGMGETPGETRVGVIAQELEELFPELVTTGDEGFKRVDYAGLAALAILGIQELRRELRASLATAGAPKRAPRRRKP